MTDDPWLERWLRLIASKAGGLPILELGCGSGRDTQVLASPGHRVVGVDLSASAVKKAAARVPNCEFHCQDIRAPFPVQATNVVLASLSLHYFPWPETIALVGRIRDVLRPSGVLLCRLNSTEDHNFGASGHPEIEPNYYLVNGEPKRFFDRAAIEKLLPMAGPCCTCAMRSSAATACPRRCGRSASKEPPNPSLERAPRRVWRRLT